MARALPIALTSGVLALAAVVWLLWAHGGAPAIPSDAVAIDGDSNVEPVSNQVQFSNGSTIESTTAQLSGDLSEADPFSLVHAGHSARIAEAELMRRAESGDTQALVALLELRDKCTPFYPADPGRHPSSTLGNMMVSDATKAQREFALKTLEAFCDRPYLAGEAREISANLYQRILDAANAGDIVARAQLMFDGETEDAIVGALTSTDDPWVIERALVVLSAPDTRFSRDLREEVFSNRVLDPQRAHRIQELAAQWYACDRGAPCGPNQTAQLNECLYRSNCGLGLGVRSFIQQRELSGFENELLQQYLAALRARLQRGP